MGYSASKPVLHGSAFVHKDALVVGDVVLSGNVSVWPGAVLRAEKGSIRVGEGSNIQGRCVMQVSSPGKETVVGRYSSVGEGAVLSGCKVGDHCVIGKGAVILEDSIIGDWSIVGEGSLVSKCSTVPARSLVFGAPARVQGGVDAYGLSHIRDLAQKNLRLMRKYQ